MYYYNYNSLTQIQCNKDLNWLILILFTVGYVIPIQMYIIALVFKTFYLAMSAMVILFIISLLVIYITDDNLLPWKASSYGELKDKSINLAYLHLTLMMISAVFYMVYMHDNVDYVLIMGLLSYFAALLTGLCVINGKCRYMNRF
eukprot:195720_1